jgi:hypothetical protein
MAPASSAPGIRGLATSFSGSTRRGSFPPAHGKSREPEASTATTFAGAFSTPRLNRALAVEDCAEGDRSQKADLLKVYQGVRINPQVLKNQQNADLIMDWGCDEKPEIY